jgi:hypothetical protein
MKTVILLLTIILAVTVSSQAQTIPKNYFLKSHVIKKQNFSTSKKIKKDSLLANSLSIEEKLMMAPISDVLYYRTNASVKDATIKYYKTTKINRKALYTTILTFEAGCIINAYCKESNAACGSLLRPLNPQFHIMPIRDISLRKANQYWIRF